MATKLTLRIYERLIKQAKAYAKQSGKSVSKLVADLFLDRHPFAEAAALMFSKVEEGVVQGYISATTITTIYDLATKTIGVRKAKWAIQRLRKWDDRRSGAPNQCKRHYHKECQGL